MRELGDKSLGRSEEEKQNPTKLRDAQLLQMYPSRSRMGVCSGSRARGVREVATTLDPPIGARSREVRRAGN